jgi:hypothetical protein
MDRSLFSHSLFQRKIGAHHRCDNAKENAIDYRCADGCFVMLPRGVAISNQNYLSSSETRSNAGIRRQELYLSEWTWSQESIGGICYTNKRRAASLRPLTSYNQKVKCGNSKCISSLNGSFFGAEHRGFLERESRPIKCVNVASQHANFFFRLHIYSLCSVGATSWY